MHLSLSRPFCEANQQSVAFREVAVPLTSLIHTACFPAEGGVQAILLCGVWQREQTLSRLRLRRQAMPAWTLLPK